MLTTPVKSTKSVVMRLLDVTETEYSKALRKIQKQTNDKSGPLFRGSFSFLVSALKTSLQLEAEDLRHVFLKYPTLFTMDERHMTRRLDFLQQDIGCVHEVATGIGGWLGIAYSRMHNAGCFFLTAPITHALCLYVCLYLSHQRLPCLTQIQ